VINYIVHTVYNRRFTPWWYTPRQGEGTFYRYQQRWNRRNQLAILYKIVYWNIMAL